MCVNDEEATIDVLFGDGKMFKTLDQCDIKHCKLLIISEDGTYLVSEDAYWNRNFKKLHTFSDNAYCT